MMGATRGGGFSKGRGRFAFKKGKSGFSAFPSQSIAPSAAMPPVASAPRRSAPTISPSLPPISHSRLPSTESAAAKKSSPAEKIWFAPGNATLTEQVQRLLDQWAAKICRNLANIKRIEIIGHADSSPADNFKQKLSLARAIAVTDYLVKQCPALTYDKLKPKGQADQHPIADNSTEAGRALNRRVEIHIKM